MFITWYMSMLCFLLPSRGQKIPNAALCCILLLQWWLLSYTSVKKLEMLAWVGLYCVFHPPQRCARSHVSMENVWDQTSVYAPQGIKDLTVMKVEFNAQNHCQSYVSNFLTITCVLLHHLPQGFLSAAWIMFHIDSRCEWVWFPGETMFPALHEYAR